MSDKGKVFIIAEAGINHNGNLRIAKKMVKAASLAGADAIKFQTFIAEKFVCRNAPKAHYQIESKKDHDSQFDMLKKLELDERAHAELFKCCRKNKIKFISSAFDLSSIDLLNRLNLDIFKVPSGELTDYPYLRKIGSLGKKIILSTGMANLKEIREALMVLRKSGTKKEDITLLHCTTAYPASFCDINLLAMLEIKNKCNIRVGYSDHTLGIEVAIAAVALGACIIEKHFTLDRSLPGVDHKASLQPGEFLAMVKAIRNIELALGSQVKKPALAELENMAAARKSIVAARPIAKGEEFSEENITVKRPGVGINPMKWKRLIGKKARRFFREDELIQV